MIPQTNSHATYLENQTRKIEKALLAYFPDSPQHQALTEAMRYSLSAGGKRIRPVILLEFCRIFGGNLETAMPSACALEMIHTASLIHDDLPEMDNDDYRRGKPSCHKAFGEAIALQAGDALCAKAFETIANAPSLQDTVKIRLIQILAKATGESGMIGGQVLDMSFEHRDDITVTDFSRMCQAKTGALIRSACTMGSVLAGATPEQIQLADTYGENLGLAFQMIDDILDVTSTTDVLGKPVGSDIQEHKTTFVTLLGLDEAKRSACAHTKTAMNILESLPNTEFLQSLTQDLLTRKQ